ncbi:hypothetical protein RUM43_007030 [Polyplax serrata]|uniref:Uncharacterized protein n=1 Tax=Polyplax serrata TaxID=468196 RepID=A0AAN8S7L3_POLSC
MAGQERRPEIVGVAQHVSTRMFRQERGQYGVTELSTVDGQQTTHKNTHAFCSGKAGGEARLCRTKIDTFSYRVSVIFSPFCDTTVFTRTRVIKQQGGVMVTCKRISPTASPRRVRPKATVRERESSG